MQPRKHYFHVVTCAICLSLLTGCFKWAPVPPDVALRAIEEQGLGLAMITVASGAEYRVRSPRARGDSIVWSDREGRSSIAYSDVRYVDRRQLEAGKTIGLLAVIGASIAFILSFGAS